MTTSTRRPTIRTVTVTVTPGDTREEYLEFQKIHGRVWDSSHYNTKGDVCGATMTYMELDCEIRGDHDILLVEHPKFRAVYEINRRHCHLHGDGDLDAYDDWRAAVMVSEGPIDLSDEMDDDEIEAAMDLAGEIR